MEVLGQKRHLRPAKEPDGQPLCGVGGQAVPPDIAPALVYNRAVAIRTRVPRIEAGVLGVLAKAGAISGSNAPEVPATIGLCDKVDPVHNPHWPTHMQRDTLPAPGAGRRCLSAWHRLITYVIMRRVALDLDLHREIEPAKRRTRYCLKPHASHSPTAIALPKLRVAVARTTSDKRTAIGAEGQLFHIDAA